MHRASTVHPDGPGEGVAEGAAANPSARLRRHVLRMRAARIIEGEQWGTPLYRGPIAAVVRTQLVGLIDIAACKHDAGLKQLRKAAADADHMSFDYGPPNSVKPAHELLGEICLQHGGSHVRASSR